MADSSQCSVFVVEAAVGCQNMVSVHWEWHFGGEGIAGRPGAGEGALGHSVNPLAETDPPAARIGFRICEWMRP